MSYVWCEKKHVVGKTQIGEPRKRGMPQLHAEPSASQKGFDLSEDVFERRVEQVGAERFSLFDSALDFELSAADVGPHRGELLVLELLE